MSDSRSRIPEHRPEGPDRQPAPLEIFAGLARPMDPRSTEEVPRLTALPDVQVVVFDIYGTLLISGSGDVGTSDPAVRVQAMREALVAVGSRASGKPADGTLIDALHRQIELQHARAAARGIDRPEVDIAEIWRRWLLDQGDDAAAGNPCLPGRLAAEFEARANPTWPMPGASEIIAELRRRGYPLGIVSNAQQFTLDVMRLHFGVNLRQVGFDPEMTLLSYRFGHAKPGRLLFERLNRALDRRGWRPHQAIYVGNDMLNDVWAARRAGLRTALFAGDARSLRWRASDPKLQGIQPDLVLTQLPQLLQCLT